MGLRARLSGWWSAWKYVVILGLLLAGSLVLNLHLYVSKRVELATAPLKDQVTALEQAQDTAAQLLEDGQKRERALFDAIDTATASARQAGRDYRAAAAANPIDPLCAPGQARQDAVNRALGAPVEK